MILLYIFNIHDFSITALLQAVKGNNVLEKYRHFQVAERKQHYPWMKFEELCLPSALDKSVDIPVDEGFELVKNISFFGKGLLHQAHALLVTFAIDHNSLAGYEQYARLIRVPEIRTYEFARWTSDVEFGRQILNGVNPVVIRRCNSLPANFPVTDEMVRDFLNHGKTLKKEMEVRKIVCQYTC